jgi:hypothetical protein
VSGVRPASTTPLAVGLAIVAILGACASPGTTASGPRDTPTGTATGSVTSSALPPIMFTVVSAEPAKRSNAELAVAFDAATAAGLMAKPPSGIDFSQQALVCLYLGDRTGAWTVSLLSAAVSAGSLSVRARETRPRSGAPGSDQITHPATCATIDRASLPVGSVSAHAEDTTSGEFIVAATISVPAR